MKRATVDTNIFISATFWHGIPQQVITMFETGKATLVLSDAILAELDRKLRHKKFAAELAETGLTVDVIVSSVRAMADLAQPADVPENAVRDPKDRMILACAVGGKADMIVSGDKDLRALNAYEGIPIVTPAQFLDILKSSSDQLSETPEKE